MEDIRVTVSLDDAFDFYELSKRDVSKTSVFCYDPVNNEFIKIKNVIKPPCVPFVNAYELCSKLMDDYLEQPKMKEYKLAFAEEVKLAKNKIVSFLWFFENIDGCRDFRNYEINSVTRVLKKWCRNNGFDWTEPEVYCVD